MMMMMMMMVMVMVNTSDDLNVWSVSLVFIAHMYWILLTSSTFVLGLLSVKDINPPQNIVQ